MFKAFVLLIGLALSGSSFAAKTAKPTTLIFTNIMHDGKKVWIPRSTDVVPGKYTFELVNNLAAPHGFEIKGLVKPVVVPAHGKKQVTVDMKKGNYKISCHMHPAHVGAEIIVK